MSRYFPSTFMQHDVVRMNAEMGAAKPANLTERPPQGSDALPSAERVERVSESPEKILEQRFGSMKKRLQEIDATLGRSDEMVKSMQGDIEGSKALGEDFQEEQRQLEAYVAEITETRAEQARLRAQLEALTSGKDVVALERQFAQTQIAEDREVMAAKASVTLDELDSARAKAIASGDRMMEDHLDGEMAVRYAEEGLITTGLPVYEAKIAQRARDQAVGAEAETVMQVAHADRPDAENDTAQKLQNSQQEQVKETASERRNMFERLVLQQKWSQEAAGGAVTEEARAIHQELHALALLIRKDIEDADYPPRDKAEQLADWDKKIEALAKEPVAIDTKSDQGKDQFMEKWNYSLSLARSAREKIARANGVTERAKALLRKAISIDSEQLRALEAGEVKIFEPEQRGKELKASIVELKELLGEKPESLEGGSIVEEDPVQAEIREAREAIERFSLDEQLQRVRESLASVAETMGARANISVFIENFSSEMNLVKGLFAPLHDALNRMKDASARHDQKESAIEMNSVLDSISDMYRKVQELKETFEVRGTSFLNTMSDPSMHEAFTKPTDVDGILNNVRVALNTFVEIEEEVGVRYRTWQAMVDQVEEQGVKSAPEVPRAAVSERIVHQEDASIEKESQLSEQKEEVRVLLKRSIAEIQERKSGWDGLYDKVGKYVVNQLGALSHSFEVDNNNIKKTAGELERQLNGGLFSQISGMHAQLLDNLLKQESRVARADDTRQIMSALDSANEALKAYESLVYQVRREEENTRLDAGKLISTMKKIENILGSDYPAAVGSIAKKRSNLNKALEDLRSAISSQVQASQDKVAVFRMKIEGRKKEMKQMANA